MSKLIFDIAITGHHSEYISHIVNYLSDNLLVDKYYFVVHTNFKKEFPEIIDKSNKCKNITWVYITKGELYLCNTGNIFQKSFHHYKILNRYALKYKVLHTVILYFNILQLALIFKRPSYTVSGILFLQFYRMEVNTIKLKLK